MINGLATLKRINGLADAERMEKKDMNALIAPINYSETVTAHDTNEIDPARGLLVGVAGDVKVKYTNGKEDTLYLAAGMWHAMQVKQVYSTGTTATGIHAGY